MRYSGGMKITALLELADASRDELRRSMVTSLPLKVKLGEELGFDNPDFLGKTEAWMIATRMRFIAAVQALPPRE